MKAENRVKNYCRSRLLILFVCLGLVLPLAMAQESRQIVNFPHPVVKEVGNGNKDNNKLVIRSVLKITGKKRRAAVEMIVESDRAFLGGDETFALYVGKQRFSFDRYGDTHAHVMVFSLSTEEFEKTKNGDEVTVTYGGASPNKDEGPRPNWKFGKLDKSKIDQ